MGLSSQFHFVKFALFWSVRGSIFPPFLLHLEVFKVMFLPSLHEFVKVVSPSFSWNSVCCVVEDVDVILTYAQKTLKDGERK